MMCVGVSMVFLNGENEMPAHGKQLRTGTKIRHDTHTHNMYICNILKVSIRLLFFPCLNIFKDPCSLAIVIKFYLRITQGSCSKCSSLGLTPCRKAQKFLYLSGRPAELK